MIVRLLFLLQMAEEQTFSPRPLVHHQEAVGAQEVVVQEVAEEEEAFYRPNINSMVVPKTVHP